MNKINTFHSKKNNVSLIDIDGDLIVHKSFRNEKAYEIEKNVYNHLNNAREWNIKTPSLISHDDDKKYLFIEYIEGCTLLEKFEEFEINNCENDANDLIMNLYKWIEKFYNIKYIKDNKLALNDMNFRNFLVKDNEIYGIDFEDVSLGKEENDIGKLVAFLLTYNPTFTPFKIRVAEKFVNYLVEEKGYEEKKIKKIIQQEIEKIHRRRSKTTNLKG